jgi:hypothetical protein
MSQCDAGESAHWQEVAASPFGPLLTRCTNFACCLLEQNISSKQNLQLLQYHTIYEEHIQNSRCTMDSWDYEECLDLVDYMPQRNNFLDIWQHEVGMILVDYHPN